MPFDPKRIADIRAWLSTFGLLSTNVALPFHLRQILRFMLSKPWRRC
jgi:hypothetical protein